MAGVRITVHRGAEEIGGTCIEIATKRTRIILDAGLPLEAEATPTTPVVEGLFSDGAHVDGVFLSHAHADHAGLIHASRAAVPVWLTDGTRQMLFAGGLFARLPNVPENRQNKLKPKTPVTVGDITVTAYPVDHSVYDCAAFLVEAEGKRVIYSGDLRLHGRKPGMARQLVKTARSAPVDALLIEGTRMGSRATEENLSEETLENRLVEEIGQARGAVLAMYSPLNVDRFVTFFRAAKRAGRIFVIDPYQAFVLHLIARSSLPTPGVSRFLEVMVPSRFNQSSAGRRLGRTRWRQQLGEGQVTPEMVRQCPEKYVVLFRTSMMHGLFPTGILRDSRVVFSYWPGYLREEGTREFVEAVRSNGGHVLPLHASGHAHATDLREFADAVRPRMLVPVHTEHARAWQEWFPATRVLRNGESIVLP